jgi:hypothetical protein
LGGTPEFLGIKLNEFYSYPRGFAKHGLETARTTGIYGMLRRITQGGYRDAHGRSNYRICHDGIFGGVLNGR